jgi:hypothetical protein
MGLDPVADASWRTIHGPADTLLVAGGSDMTPVTGNRKLLNWPRTMSRRTWRIPVQHKPISSGCLIEANTTKCPFLMDK